MAEFTKKELKWLKNLDAELKDGVAVIENGKFAFRVTKKADNCFQCIAGGGNISTYAEDENMKKALLKAFNGFNDLASVIAQAKSDCDEMIFNLNDLK